MEKPSVATACERNRLYERGGECVPWKSALQTSVSGRGRRCRHVGLMIAPQVPSACQACQSRPTHETPAGVGAQPPSQTDDTACAGDEGAYGGEMSRRCTLGSCVSSAIGVLPSNATTSTSIPACWASDSAWYCMRGLRPKSPITTTCARSGAAPARSDLRPAAMWREAPHTRSPVWIRR